MVFYLKSKIITLNKTIENFIYSPVSSRIAYFTLLAVALIFILPVINANISYVDDLARQQTGYYQWATLGRFITEALMHILTFSKNNMADMGQQMQWLSIPVLALAGWVFGRTLTGKEGFNKVSIAVAAIIVVNPFLLTNISFRFDSFSMILAYFCSIFSATILFTVRKNPTFYRYLLSSALLLFALGLYQTMALMFLVTLTVLFVADFFNQDTTRSSVKTLAWGVIEFITVFGLYAVLVHVFNPSNIGGVGRGLLVSFDNKLLPNIVSNIQNGWNASLVFTQNAAAKILWIGVCLITFGTVAFIVIRNYIGHNRRGAGLVLVVVSPVILLFSIVGPFALLASSLTFQIRTLSSAIGLVVLCGTLIYVLSRHHYRVANYLLLVPLGVILYCLNFSFIYGSALAEQRAYDNSTYSLVSEAAINSPSLQNASMVFVGGEMGSPKSVENDFVARPILRRMDIDGDNSTWYIWNSLSNQHIVKQTDWLAGAAKNNIKNDVCSQHRGYKILSNSRFVIYEDKGLNVDFIWLTNPAGSYNNDFCNSPG